MNRKEILEKLKERKLLEKKRREHEEFECECIMYNVCPDCGTGLIKQWFSDFCPGCKTIFKFHRDGSCRWVERKKK